MAPTVPTVPTGIALIWSHICPIYGWHYVKLCQQIPGDGKVGGMQTRCHILPCGKMLACDCRLGFSSVSLYRCRKSFSFPEAARTVFQASVSRVLDRQAGWMTSWCDHDDWQFNLQSCCCCCRSMCQGKEFLCWDERSI